MLILVLALIVIWLITMLSSHNKIQKLEAEITARRTYDNERNLRILWANERDACDEMGDADGFYETYGKEVSRLELDLEADLGSVERSGNGYFGLVRTDEQIQKLRRNMEERGKKIRDTFHKNQAAIQATEDAEAMEDDKKYQKSLDDEAERQRREETFLEALNDAPDDFSAADLTAKYINKISQEAWWGFWWYVNKINPELAISLNERWRKERVKNAQ